MSSSDTPVPRPRVTVPSVDPATLWDEFSPALRGFLARRVPPGIDPDDLVQDVFLRVIRHLADLRRTDRPEAWLYQIARNALRDALRARLRRESRTDALDDDLPAETDASADRAAEAELAPCLTGMIQRLAEPYRTALTLTSLQGVTQAAAAQQLGLSISGMKSRVQRGRDQLRQLLVTCCAITVDGRGAVSDFYRRSPDRCGTSSRTPVGCGCGATCGPGTARASLPQDRRPLK